MPLHERQRESSWCKGAQIEFQFTPLHERQPMLFLLFRAKNKISIHASTWEATFIGVFFSYWILFQFTPLHERQQEERADELKVGHFNSRLYMRGNDKEKLKGLYQHYISIHASTWEATSEIDFSGLENLFQFTPLHERQHHDACAPCEVRDFNSRLYMRGSLLGVGGCRKGKDFNSRLYMRGSLYSRCHNRKEENFNSRLYMRGSVQHGWTIMVEQISIHASTWEAAQSRMAKRRGYSISIHASTWEAADDDCK